MVLPTPSTQRTRMWCVSSSSESVKLCAVSVPVIVLGIDAYVVSLVLILNLHVAASLVVTLREGVDVVTGFVTSPAGDQGATIVGAAVSVETVTVLVEFVVLNWVALSVTFILNL